MVITDSQTHRILSKRVSFLTDLHGELFLIRVFGFLREAPEWMFFLFTPLHPVIPIPLACPSTV